MRGTNKLRTLITLAVVAALTATDQLIKALAVAGLPGRPVAVIGNLFYLTYVENRGAAFGMFQGGTRVLGVFSLLVSAALLAVLLSGKVREAVWHWCLALILAGGVGNCIDRFARGFVVDYFDFSALFGFPVFNYADCCVVCGTLILLASVLIIEKKKEKTPGAPKVLPAEATPEEKPEEPGNVLPGASNSNENV